MWQVRMLHHLELPPFFHQNTIKKKKKTKVTTNDMRYVINKKKQVRFNLKIQIKI